MTIHVSLTPELERLVRERVASGLYGNASEVVREALRLLSERDGERDARLEESRSRIRRRGWPGNLPEPSHGSSLAAETTGRTGHRDANRELAAARLREAFELLRLSYDLVEQALRGEHPGASDSEIGQRLADRTAESDWAEETPGYLVRSPERLAKLLRDPDRAPPPNPAQ